MCSFSRVQMHIILEFMEYSDSKNMRFASQSKVERCFFSLVEGRLGKGLWFETRGGKYRKIRVVSHVFCLPCVLSGLQGEVRSKLKSPLGQCYQIFRQNSKPIIHPESQCNTNAHPDPYLKISKPHGAIKEPRNPARPSNPQSASQQSNQAIKQSAKPPEIHQLFIANSKVRKFSRTLQKHVLADQWDSSSVGRREVPNWCGGRWRWKRRRHLSTGHPKVGWRGGQTILPRG